MKIFFQDGDSAIGATEITPTEDTILPPFIMVGQYCFMLDEQLYSKSENEWVAVYQPVQPLVLPSSQAINSHFMLRQTLKGQTQ